MRTWLKCFRENHELSQKETAKRVMISYSYYNLIETGVRRPSPEVAKRIATVLGFANEWYRLLEVGGEQTGKKPASAG